VKEAQIDTHAGLPAGDDARVGNERAAQTYPTPTEVLAQIGRVLAFCLGLALLAHVLVAVAGMQ
jgi:hypothetical protein